MPKIFSKILGRPRLEGQIDGIAGDTLRGWAWLPSAPTQIVSVEIRVENILLASANCNLFRIDLADEGRRDGYCAFEIPIDRHSLFGKSIQVTALLANKRHELPGSPLAIPVPANLHKDDEPKTSVLPLPIVARNVKGFLDQCGPDRIRGWAHRIDDTNKPLSLALCKSGKVLLSIEPNQWRSDIAELRKGDGCCGFDLQFPEVLRDGQLHELELRITETNKSALAKPFTIRFHKQQLKIASTSKIRPRHKRQTAPSLTLSIIVNFYNMHREAARTLVSLSRQYQSDIEGLDYEVLCIDNGSSPAMNSEWIAGFGPQFQLIRPSAQLTSPCFAINEAAALARGRYLAIMIDGAHLLTPGVFREAVKAWKEDPVAVIALRHWFVGGDQRWLASAGYTRTMEDKLFERIRWPNNGYELFRISAPIGESPEPWFDGLSESNCLMLPTELYDHIGGMDEAFDQAGGGFANLDLWRRAREATTGTLFAMVGEATFHQFHGGTTTNVEDMEKDVRVRAYANQYRALRGREYESAHRSTLTLRGHMPSEFATGIRQRTLLPLRMGVTGQVRKGQMSLHFDEGAQAYLQSTYAECQLQQLVTWLGLPTGVAPADLHNLQEIMHELRPDAVVSVGAQGGLIGFIDSVLSATSNQGARILSVNPAFTAAATPNRCTVLPGRSDDDQVLATVRHWIGSAETVLVLHSAQPADFFSVPSLQAYSSLVSFRAYLVCLGTLFGQPWLGYSSHQPLKVIQDFIQSNSQFVIDRCRDQQMLSTCPSGYLRKVGGSITALRYDSSLDDLDQPLFENSL